MITRTQKHSVKTRYGAYICVFEREKDMGGYAVEALRIQGAVSWGKTLGEAKRMITEAIEGLVEASAIAEAERIGAVRLVHRVPRPLELILNLVSSPHLSFPCPPEDGPVLWRKKGNPVK